MEQFTVKQMDNLNEEELTHLVEESKREGFRFLDRLIRDYKNGSNAFDQRGESLWGVFDQDGQCVAIGGLNRDPYATETSVGRLRRFYVSSTFRRMGIGKLLLKRIIHEANLHFHVLVLNTDTERGDKFYTSFGFIQESRYPQSTHWLRLK
ncbi:Acetyltransferase (GNAT) domain-containing protein [Fictibacillus enclensis]|uniref:GNAT family acetyltransferase n=1 Tax=Fictibacillus enclensis TaxID=1017270 RepID=A0A0V8J2B6_9BACL|nr:GNAT family N-acetyltransferase [Fictibacillus enclensis]KSU81175.1 GNAT family acetyltransferase [Fictibacillus enclensis]SCC35814.1 Acetyltransferase (GNAT) domain-containing protein [Fictibacillus enclensis]